MLFLAGLRHVFLTTLGFIAVGPLAGTALCCLYDLLTNILTRPPHGRLFIADFIAFLPLSLLVIYVVGCVPAAMTGLAIGLADVARIRIRGIEAAIGAACLTLFAYWVSSPGYEGSFLRFQTALQLAAMGGASTWATVRAIRRIGPFARSPAHLYRDADGSGWH